MQSIRQNIAWSAIPLAGLAGGTVFLLLVVLLALPWLGVEGGLILSYFAALVLGPGALVEGGSLVILIGVAVHYALSLIYAIVIAFVVHRWGLLVGILGGAVLGLSLYGINLYTLTILFPWFYAINSVLLLVGHVAYGAVVGGVYELFDTYDVGREPKTEVTHEAV